MANTQKNPCHALKKAIFRDNVEKAPFFVFKKHKLAGNQFFFSLMQWSFFSENQTIQAHRNSI